MYHVTKTKDNLYHIVMNKLVNGKEEDMTELDYVFDAKAGTLVCDDKQHDLLWSFRVKGLNMNGSLTRGEIVYRVIRLTKRRN